MKVNTSHIPDDNQTTKKSKAKKSKVKKPMKDKNTVPENKATSAGGNVYKESLKKYADKWKNDGIFKQNKFWFGVALVLFMIFLSVNSNANNTRTHLMVQLKRTTADTESLNNAIAETKADLEEQAKIDSVKLTEEEEELARNDAKAQGQHVAYLQNRYLELDISDPDFNKNKNELNDCFDKDSQNWRVPWYSPTQNPETKEWDGIIGKWEFVTNASFKGNTADVLWLCYADDPNHPNDHSLLAYCEAKYNADTGLFSKVDCKLTGYANANIGTDGQYNVNDSRSWAEQIKDSVDQGVITPPDNNNSVSSNDAVSEVRQSYRKSVANREIEGVEYDHNYDPGLDESSDE